jgi:hypothetical protein
VWRRGAGTAKLPLLGASDLSPHSAWYAQQVGHPPRLLQLRRSLLPRSRPSIIQLRSASKGNAGGLVWRRGAGTAKLPSLGASDLSPCSAWYAQQVGHPPRLLQLRRSLLPRSRPSIIQLRSASKGNAGGLVWRRGAGTAKLPLLGASDLSPRSAWYAQQVGHPPRLLQLRRSRLPRSGPSVIQARSASKGRTRSVAEQRFPVFSRTSLSLRVGSDAPLAASRCRSRTVGCCRDRGTPGSC